MIDEKSKYDPGRLLELHAQAEAARARLRSLSDRRDELRERGYHWQRQLQNLRMDYAPSHDVGKAIKAAEAKIAELAAARQAIDREAAEVSEIRTARASNFQAALERAKELGLEIPLEIDRGGSGLTSVPHLYMEASQ